MSTPMPTSNSSGSTSAIAAAGQKRKRASLAATTTTTFTSDHQPQAKVELTISSCLSTLQQQTINSSSFSPTILRPILQFLRTTTRTDRMQNIQLGDSRVDLARKLTQSTNTNTKGDSAEERSDGGILLTLWSKLEKDYQISIIGNSNPTLSNLLLNLQIQLLETVSNVLRILNCNYITHEDGVPLILQLLPSSSSSLNMPSSETSTGIYWKKLISYLSTIDSKGNRSGTGAGAGFEARNSIAIYPFNEGLVLASLRVIRTMNEYQDFKRCRKLEVGMPWDSKILQKLLSHIRKPSKSSKKKPSLPTLCSPDIQTSSILLILSFLGSSSSSSSAGGCLPFALSNSSSSSTSASTSTHPNVPLSLKTSLLLLPTSPILTILKSLKKLPNHNLVVHILLALQNTLVRDPRIQKVRKIGVFNEWVLKDLTGFMEDSRPVWNGVLGNGGSDQEEKYGKEENGMEVEEQKLDEIVHGFLTGLCANRGKGINYEDEGWFPRTVESDSKGENLASEVLGEGFLDSQDQVFNRNTSNSSKPQAISPIRNKILLSLLKYLTPTRNVLHSSLTLSILEATPELIPAWLPNSSLMSSILEVRNSSSWIGGVGFLSRCLTLSSEEAETDGFGPLSLTFPEFPIGKGPPPFKILIEGLIPSPSSSSSQTPLHGSGTSNPLKNFFLKAIGNDEKLVRFISGNLLIRILERVEKFREICLQRALEEGEFESQDEVQRAVGERFLNEMQELKSGSFNKGNEGKGRWLHRLDQVEKEVGKRLPDFGWLLAMLWEKDEKKMEKKKGKKGDSEDVDEKMEEEEVIKEESENKEVKHDFLLTEMKLRIVEVYQRALPKSCSNSSSTATAGEGQIDIGKLLSGGFVDHSSIEVGMEVDGAGERDSSSKILNNRMKVLCQLHCLRIISPGSFLSTPSSTSTSKNLQEPISTNFDIFAKTSNGTNPSAARSYFCLLLAIYIGSHEAEIREACELVLRDNVSRSGILGDASETEESFVTGYVGNEWKGWKESLPIGERSFDFNSQAIGSPSNDSTTQDLPSSDDIQTSNSIPDAISEEQACVLIFLDDCAQRCVKNIWRYKESGKNLLASTSNSTTERRVSIPPLLMVFLEQFSIRSKKRIFDPITDTAVDDSTSERIILINFLTRFLVNFIARNGNDERLIEGVLGNLKEVQRDLMEGEGLEEGRGKGNVPYAFKTMVDSINVLREEKDDLMERKKGKDLKGFEKSCLATNKPRSIRNLLRSVARPLSSNDVLHLTSSVFKLVEVGHQDATQILTELNPMEENLWLAIGSSKESSIDLPSCVYLIHALAFDPIKASSDKINNVGMDLNFKKVSDIEKQSSSNLLVSRTKASVSSTSTSSVSSDLAILEQFLNEDSNEMVKVICFDSKTGLPSILREEKDGEKRDELLTSLTTMIVRVVDSSDPQNRVLVNGITEHLIIALEKTGSASRMAIEGELCFTSSLHLVEQALIFLNDSQLFEVSQIIIAALEGKVEEKQLENLFDILRGSIELASNPSKVLQFLESNLFKLVALASRVREGSRGALISLLESILSDSTSFIAPQGHQQVEDVEVMDFLKLSDEKGVDSITSKLIYRSRSLATKVSNYVNKHVSSDSSIAARIPLSIHAYLNDLSKSLGVENFTTEPVLIETLVTSCFEEDLMISGLACSSVGLLFSSAKEVNQEGTILELLANSIPSTPSSCFKLGFISLVTSILGAGGLALPEPASKLVHALLDNGLLWLVRRFAEDEQDSPELVEAIKVFNTFVEKCWNKAIQPKPHLADPVIEAAIKNRLSEVHQVGLISSLCKRSSLKSTSLSRHLNAILAHSSFSVVAGRLGEDSDQVDASTPLVEAKERNSQVSRRDSLVKLIHSIAMKDVEALASTSASSKFISIYGGSLSFSDRHLLEILFNFENTGRSGSFLTLLSSWSPTVYGSLGSNGENVKAMDALLALDPTKVMNTCTVFPRARSFYSSVSGLDPSVVDDENDVEGEVAGESLYDPCFVLGLLGASLAEVGFRLSGLQWLAILRSNALGLAVCSLSSRCNEIRETASSILSGVHAGVSSIQFVERDHFLLILDSLRDSIPPVSSEEDDGSSPSLPITTTLFVAQALRSLTAPSSFTYPIFSRFLLQRPELDISDVPLFYNLLNSSSSETHRQEKAWILRFLRDSIKAGGRNEWKILKRRHTLDAVMSLYSSISNQVLLSGNGSGNGSSGNNVESFKSSRELIRQIILGLVSKPSIAMEVIGRRALLNWIVQEQSLERRSSLPESQDQDAFSSTKPNSTSILWIQVLEKATRNIDLDKLDSLTGNGTWISTSMDILLNATGAQSNPSSSIPIWSQDSIEEVKSLTLTSRVIRRIMEHLRKNGIRTHQRGLIDNSILQLLSFLIDRSIFLKNKNKIIKIARSGEQEEESQLREEIVNQNLRSTSHHLYEAILSFPHVSGSGVARGGKEVGITKLFEKVLGLELGFGGEEAREMMLSLR